MGKKRDSNTNSWSSKLSNDSIDGYKKYCISPSSILSSSSDLTFTTKKLNSQLRCGCYIIASLLCFLLVCSISIYAGFTFFISHKESKQIFRVQFRVMDGDRFTLDLTNTSSNAYRVRSRDYKERLDLLFRRSFVKYSFVGTEILALDGSLKNELIVHFNLKLDSRYLTIDASTIDNIIRREIRLQKESLYFNDLLIDPNSLNVSEYCERCVLENQNQTGSGSGSNGANRNGSEIASTTTTTATPAPKVCTPIRIGICSAILPYNRTTYPNHFGHRTHNDSLRDIVLFRELIDSECYRRANDFLCKLLQPNCLADDDDDDDNTVVRAQQTCRHYCREFVNGCGSRLPAKLKPFFDCGQFPELVDDPNCLPKTNCIGDLKLNRTCDGLIDCHDVSDELNCSYCSEREIHCGIGRKCIAKRARCDGRIDCPNASDEKLCLSLEQNRARMTLKRDGMLTPYAIEYNSNGIVTFTEKGELGKLCADNLSARDAKQVAVSLCQSLSFRNYVSSQKIKDVHPIQKYVQVSNITKSEIKFEKSICEKRNILQVQCANLTCGALPVPFNVHKRTNLYWPWHVVLQKNNVHTCDATLVHTEWLMTTMSCFQGQNKAEWMATFGVNRFQSNPPWLSERRIIGMVKSPIEGSSMVLLKLERPVTVSDFVRPICLPPPQQPFSEAIGTNRKCVTLGWSKQTASLRIVPIVFKPVQYCENFSVRTKDSICTENEFSADYCMVEEYAGTSLICMETSTPVWKLIGISNWRIDCSVSAIERPKLFDQISSNLEWIEKTINQL